MLSGEMIDLVVDAAVRNKTVLRRLLMDMDKHLLFKLVHGMTLGHSEKNLKETMEALGCHYPREIPHTK